MISITKGHAALLFSRKCISNECCLLKAATTKKKLQYFYWVPPNILICFKFVFYLMIKKQKVSVDSDFCSPVEKKCHV